MTNSSFLRDILVLIGVLPIVRPVKIEQQGKKRKRMGYPVNYLVKFSTEEREQMHRETELLMALID